jgi:hypothetical protein
MFHLTLALAGILFVSSTASGQFAGTVLSYERGTGFAANFTNASTALGAPAAGSGVTPYAPPFSPGQMVSIGAGGSLTLQFGSPILNDPGHPFGIDFLIFGNSFFVVTNGSGSGAITSGALFTSSVATRVAVSADGNTWFTLDSSLAPTVGTLFPTDGIGNPQQAANPGLGSSDFAGLNLGGIRSLYNGSAGGGGFDLGWARDGEGNAVDLASVDYVRIDVLSGRTQVDAIAAVPEPAGWALGLAGVSLLWLRCAWRRSAGGGLNGSPRRASAPANAVASATAAAVVVVGYWAPDASGRPAVRSRTFRKSGRHPACRGSCSFPSNRDVRAGSSLARRHGPGPGTPGSR